VPLLRTTRVLAFLVVLCPLAAHAAPASKKPAEMSQGPKPIGPPKPAGLKNVKATAHLAPVAAPQRAQPSKSIGSPTDGHLIGGVRLADAPYLRIYPSYGGSDVRWGTDSLVGLIDRSAKSVRKQFPDAVLSVGQLSKNGGGEVDRHASHESGRDADVGFYVKNAAGKPILGDHMVAFVGDGTAPSWPGAHFDDARNWALVSSIVGDGHVHVTHLFVATPIRERLLAYAAKIGASPAIRSKASEVLAQPRGSLPHDDHFHVRIACPGGSDGKCIEQPLARHGGHGHAGAVASNGHPAHPSHEASSHESHESKSEAAHAQVAAPAAHAAVPKPAAPKSESHEDTSMPSLSPSVPGLDSAVIPAPLVGVQPTWGNAKKADPISDPDGVLENN
jgi:penicillin-insensitive murein endopeptidase